MENKINPIVSTWTLQRRPYKGEELKLIPLYTVLKQCEVGIKEDSEKGTNGAIFPYMSTVANPSTIQFDGVVFVDIDHCSGVSDKIFNSFEDICKLVPQTLAVNYSYSRNLHFYVYDESIKKDPSKYGDKAIMYMCCLAAAIKKVTGIDLRDIDGALDTHCKSPYQRMFLNYSLFKWNINCFSAEVGKDTQKRLKSEYHHLYNQLNEVRTLVETKAISGDGSTVIDKDYNLLGYGTGYDARTYIASAVYFHFREDVNKAREYLSKTFANAEEINKQMTSMIANGKISGKFRKDVEDFLFGMHIGDKYILKENEFLSDVIDVDKLNDKYYYIQSNTGTGKTEFVKNFIKKTGGNVIIIQITKALRDGKSGGIEDITYGNWDTIIDRSKIHTTIEGAVRNCLGMDLSGYTVVVDESHLLEEYIGVRRGITTDLLTMLSGAGKVIFMSATPKSDINMFKFTKMTFEKIQPQDIKIYQHPMKMEGTGSREASEYEYIINYVKKLSEVGEKVIVFSNKKQESWKKYGLENETVTYFNANNIENEQVQSILKDNKLDNNITLSTKYMGCGVEVKGEKEVHIVFNLNEGFDKDFIVQSIGRPRSSGGVERVVVHFFYTEGRKWSTRVGEEELVKLENAFKNLVTEGEEGERSINILAAKMLNIFDPEFNNYSVRDKIEILWFGNYVNERIYHTPYSVDVLRKMPYRKVEVINLDAEVINTDGRVRRVRREDELLDYLCSLEGWQITELGKKEGYEKLLKNGEIPYNDITNARKVITDVKYIIRRGLELRECLDYFDDVKRAVAALRSLVTYARIQAGINTVEEFDGSEEAKKNLDAEIEKVKRIFTEGYIQKVVDEMCGVVTPVDVELDWNFADVVGVSVGKIEKEPVFIGKSYDDVKKKMSKEKAGKKGGVKGSPKKSIKIKRMSDKKVFKFDSKSEAMKWIGWSSQKFSKFIKDRVDKDKTYELL